MNKFFLLLADVDASDLLDAHRQFADTRSLEILSMLGALVLSVIVATIWAVLYSKKKKKSHKHRHHHHHHQSQPSGPPAKAAESAAAAPEESKSRRKRRQRRPHRPLNPTLAQTGGLPPLRDRNTPPAGL